MSASPLLRLTVVGGRRRFDLLVPAVLPVVELLPELARSAGIPPGTGCTVAPPLGRRLDPELPLAAQGVGDGGVLMLLPDSAPAPVVRYDDPVEAWSERRAAIGRRPMRPAPRTLVVTAAVVVAVVGLALLVFAPALAWWAALDQAVGPSVRRAAAPVAVAVVGLGCAVPPIALAVLRTPPRGAHLDPARADAELRSAVRLAAALGGVVTALLALLAPLLVPAGRCGPALAVAVATAVLLEAPRGGGIGLPIACGPVLLAVVLGTVVVLRPDLRAIVGVGLAMAGTLVALVVVTGVRPPGWLPRRRLLDAARIAVLVVLAPLAAVVAGFPDLVR